MLSHQLARRDQTRAGPSTRSYSADEGRGSHTFAHADGLRSALLGTLAAGSLLLGYGRRTYAQTVSPPNAPCNNVVGTTATCTGNVAAGISAGAPYTVLNVNTLSADITPGAGTDGINFTSAGSVTVTTNTGTYAIQTTGAGGDGIYARSTGGAGVTVNSTGDVSSAAANAIHGYSDGAGTVSVTSSGDVQGSTYGIYARAATGGDVTVMSDGSTATAGTGIYARNGVGGGTVTVTATGDVEGTGGAAIRAISAQGGVTVTSTNVTTNGGYAAIFASSFGAQAVDINVNGDVQATNNIGVFAQGNAGAITVDVTGEINAAYGVISSGGASSTITLNDAVNAATVGVRFQNGTTNVLNNDAALSGGTWAVEGGTGNETINNDKTITGNVNLGAGSNAFNNNATFRPGTTVNLGAGNALTNAGLLSPGGESTLQATAVTGDLVQTGAGILFVDVSEAGGGADSITVSGTANLSGIVAVNVIDLTSSSGSVVIVSAAALASTATLFNASAIAFSLSVQNNQLILSWGGSGILGRLANPNANQRAVATYLDALAAAGPEAALQALIDALTDLGDTDLVSALNQLIPAVYSDAQVSTLFANQALTGNLLSCKVNGLDTAAIIREGQCLWAGANATFLDRGTTFQQLGFTETTGTFAAGVQVALDDVWRLGFGAGYQSSSLDTATNASSEGQLAQAGVALKYSAGPFLAAATLSGGRGWYDSARPVSFGAFAGNAQSETTIDVFSGGGRLAYVLGSPQLYFKPVLDAAATRLDLGGFSETGGGAANLIVQASQQTVYSLAPSLEIGTEWWLSNGTLLRPSIRGGATFYEGGDFALTAAFAGAPAGVTPFTINTDMDDVMGTVGAGLDMITAGDTVLRFSYDGQLGETTQIHAIGLKGSVSF
jgi:Autotransporter beta-domain